MTINYIDLIGREWADMHCGQVTVTGLERMGMLEASRYVALDQQGASELLKLHRDGSSPWLEVGTQAHHAQLPGDLILSDSEEGLHSSLNLGNGMALTSSRRHGVYAISLGRLSGVVAVYRWGGLA